MYKIIKNVDIDKLRQGVFFATTDYEYFIKMSKFLDNILRFVLLFKFYIKIKILTFVSIFLIIFLIIILILIHL